MNDIIKNKAEIFKQICLFELNEVKITSETFTMDNGSQRCFEFVIKNKNDEIICLGEMPPVKNIESYIKSIEDKIEKGLINYNVFIYSIQYDKIMYITPYREWLRYDFESGITPKDFIKGLKYSYEEFKQEDDLEFDRLKEEIKNLKQHNSENEKKYEKFKYDSELYKKIYNREIDELKNQSDSIKKNEIDRLKYELKKNNANVDLFNPLKKLGLNEKREYCFNFQKDEIILKVDLWWYFEGGKDEVAGYHYSGCKYYLLDLDKKEYVEVNDNRYSDIINWLRFDWDYKLMN
jgi:hypothetical protein